MDPVNEDIVDSAKDDGALTLGLPNLCARHHATQVLGAPEYKRAHRRWGRNANSQRLRFSKVPRTKTEDACIEESRPHLRQTHLALHRKRLSLHRLPEQRFSGPQPSCIHLDPTRSENMLKTKYRFIGFPRTSQNMNASQ